MSYHQIDKFSSSIRDMIADGYTPKEILKNLTSKGCRATLKALIKYLSDNNLEIVENDLEPIRPEVVDEEKSEAKDFDFQEIINSEFNPVEYTEQLQKIYAFLVKRQLEITAKEQENYYLGLAPTQPLMTIHKLKILQEELYKIAPLNLISNQQQAIKIVQRMGYTISFEEEIIDADTNPNSSPTEED